MRLDIAITIAISAISFARVLDWPTNKEPNLNPTIAFWDDDYAPSAEWTTYASKGGALMCALQGTDQAAGLQLKDTRSPPSAASHFTSDLKTELHNWYWRSVNPSSFGCSFSDYWGFPKAMQALGLSGTPASKGGDNKCYRVEHWDPERRDENGNQIHALSQWYNVPGIERQYRATMAHYEFGINIPGGALYGLFLESPQAAAKRLWHSDKKDTDKNELPQLRLFSDILWGFWVRDNPNVKNVRYLFMIGILNDVTNRLIASCLRDVGVELSVWPGVEFDMETEQGKALLASPNGAAFAYFLIQHKAQLGPKTIKKVTVFRPENGDDNSFVDASLCFHVGDGTDGGADGDSGIDIDSSNSSSSSGYDEDVDVDEVKTKSIIRQAEIQEEEEEKEKEKSITRVHEVFF